MTLAATAAKAPKSKDRPKITFYRTYRFRAQEKDPIIDCLHTMFQDAKVSIRQVHELSDVAEQTMRNWFDGDTRRPSHTTVCAVVGALDYEFYLRKRRRTNSGHAQAPVVER